MTAAAILYRLEQVDTELTRTEARLQEVRRRQARNPALETAETRLQALRERVRAAEVEQRARESNLTDLEAKIARDNTRMYSGRIVDPRELASLEREIEGYRRQRDALEEECLQGLERADGFQAQIAVAEQQMEEMRQSWQESGPVLVRQSEQLEAALANLRSERETLVERAGPRMAETYARLRASLGHAVSQISGGVCQVCRVTVSPRDIQHARGEDLVMCTNCGRILYTES